MITVIMLGYCGLVFLAFKVIKIKVTPTNIAAAGLIGIFLMIFILVNWKMSAPLTDQMFLRRRVLLVNPDVREFVSKVHVTSNQIVKKGDALFDINSERFEDAVEQATAEVEAAKYKIQELKSQVAAAEERVKQSAADTATAKAQLDTATAVQEANPAAIAKLKVQEARLKYRADQADDKVAVAQLNQAKLALKATEHQIKVVNAQLRKAKFDLNRTTYTSPIDGQVLNWQITPGTPAARWRFTSIGTVQDFSDTKILGILPQNQLKNVKSGNAVEIAFKRRPGQIVTGKVAAVVKYTGEGQFMPTAQLPIAADVGSKGDLAVRIELDDGELAKQLPLGAAGSLTIYTDVGETWHIISKITIRIKNWLNYLPM